jgi:protein TonB
MKSINKNRSQHSFAFIFSLALHAIAFTYFYQKAEEKDVATTATTALQNSRTADRTLKLDSVKFITKKQLEIIKEKNKQIVANELNGRKERPVDSRFAGESDQTFDRQTIAAANGAFKKAGQGTKDGSATEKAQATEQSAAPLKTAQAQKERLKNDLKNLRLSDLGAIQISKIEDEGKIQAAALEDMNRRLATEAKRNAAQGIAKGSKDETGFSRNNDFVEDIPLGDMTNLNTTEFKYYGFYHRIRQRLEQYWGSSIQSKAKNLYKSGRRLPASENLITAITVTLDDRGQILDIKIDGTSGVRELDQAAIESFNKAGPFPNPPKGVLIGGRAVIQWGFVVKS